jgi:16S rRNA (cytosine967-C5)-methyltransferase
MLKGLTLVYQRQFSPFMISPSRELAFSILLEVENGAFAADLLATRSALLDSRDAGLAAAITLGSLRFRAQLDVTIQKLTGKPLKRLDPEVREALRIGIFQVRHLDRIPAHAAVSQSVELVKQNGKKSAAGLVNAVLRKVLTTQETWADRATQLSCPEWLVARWSDAFGAEVGEAIAASALETPRRYARIPANISVPEGALLTEVPSCFELPAGTSLPAGAVWQDLGSQSIVPLLELQPHHRVLDLCSAPGNKTAQIRESGAWTLACDVSSRRLDLVPEPRVVLDARVPLPFAQGAFDRILVDAPCTGTGTLAHNPEIKWRVSEADIRRHAERQRAILRAALTVLKPGGLLVYSTCSLEKEENEDVVNAVAPQRIMRTVRRLPGRDAGDGFFAAVLA